MSRRNLVRVAATLLAAAGRPVCGLSRRAISARNASAALDTVVRLASARLSASSFWARSRPSPLRSRPSRAAAMINRARSRACSGESVAIWPSVTVRFVREPRMRKLTMWACLLAVA